MGKLNLTINGKEVTANPGQTILDVARENNMLIPTLCHDDRLKPFGSCLLCRIEVEGARGNMLACATQATDGMTVRTETDAVNDARRMCLELLLSQHYGDCTAPCSMTCPAGIDVQGYIAHIANGQYQEAVKLIKERNPLPVVCGRVCTRPCEDECRRNLVDERVGIDYLKRFASDYDLNSDDHYVPNKKAATGKKAAVIGAGPAGLSCAFYLAREGHKVTIFERWPRGGGMLRYGIPEYRMPKAALDKEIDTIKELGVEIQYEKTFGADVTYESLKKDGYEAIFLGIGSQVGQPIGCEGEACPMGVYAGVDFLGRVGLGHNIDLSGKHVIVIGGGNTAIDASRTALRLGAKKVTVAYRRTKKEMPAHEMEIEEAEYEGVEFEFLIAPKQIVSDAGKPIYIEFIRMELGEPDASGRRRPIEIPGSEFKMPADYVIGAIGQTQDLSFINDGFNLEAKNNKIVINPDLMATNIEGVFAGGDGVTGPQTAIKAIAAGRIAAYSMDKYLRGEKIEKLLQMYNHVKGQQLKDIDKKEFEQYEKIDKNRMPMLSKEERKHNFLEVELGFTEEQAKAEAQRCLSCGCKDIHECKLREFATTYGAKQDRLAGAITKHPIDESHPFISRDKNKCIMCGRCVRICLEVQGAGALGFISRGYNTTIEPSFGKPFGEDSRCESCGQCVSTCPVGALTEKVQLPKPGPFVEKIADTICNNCGTGCTLKLHISGDRFIRATSEAGLGVNNGNLCEKGRFQNSFINSPERIIKPMIRKEGKLVESSWEEAYKLINEKMKSHRAMGFVSQKATNEEVAEMKKLVSSNIYSFDLSDAAYGLQDSFGRDYKKASYEDINKADAILCLGFDIKEENPVAALMVKAAAEKGAELIMVSEAVSKLDRYAGMAVRLDDNKIKDFAEALVKAAEGEAVDGAVAALAAKLKKAVSPLIMIGGAAGHAEAKAATELVKALDKNEESILLMQNKPNSLGLVNEGVKAFKAAEMSLRDNAVLIYGEDPIGTGNPEAEKALKEAAFVAVFDMLLTETAKLADVVLPITSFAENEGTYTNSEGRVQKLNKAMEPKTGKSNMDVIKSL